MTYALSYIASTPQGARLGQLAAQSAHLVRIPSPWWTCPLEPLRWVLILFGVAPHAFFSLGAFAVLSFVLGLLWMKRARQGAGFALAAMATVMLTLCGVFFSLRYLDTYMPGGTVWEVPADAEFRLANLHAHSQFSGGALMPDALVRWHYDHGYRVVALSDSNGMRGLAMAQKYVESSGLPMTFVPAEEYRGTTHLLLLNAKEPIVPKLLDVEHAIAAAKAQGALVVVAHPWTSDRTPQELISWGVDGFEVSNGGVVASHAIQALASEKHLAILGSLDFRGGNRPLTATVLPAWANTAAKVQQALAKGECASLYVPEEVDDGKFNFFSELQRTVQRLFEERLLLLFEGLAFWVVVVLIVRQLRWQMPRLHVRHGLLLVVILSAMTAALAVWCMWWQFRSDWLRTEWSFLVWIVVCPFCWFVLRGNATESRAPEVWNPMP